MRKPLTLVILPAALLLSGCFQQASQSLPFTPTPPDVMPASVGITTEPQINSTSLPTSSGQSVNPTEPGIVITIIEPTRGAPMEAPTEIPPPTTAGGEGVQFVTPISPIGPITPDVPTALPPELQSATATPSGLITPTALDLNNVEGNTPSEGSSGNPECQYTVQPGDTLYRIAINNDTTVSGIREANGLSGDIIQPGQVLTLPDCEGNGEGSAAPTTSPPTAAPANPPAGSSTSYTVQPGDTLFIIAQRYGVSVQAIVNANNLTNPNRLSVGQELVIPAPSG